MKRFFLTNVSGYFTDFSASLSKLCTGQKNLHWEVCDNPNGVEKLKVCVTPYNDEIVPQIDFEQLKIDIINETF